MSLLNDARAALAAKQKADADAAKRAEDALRTEASAALRSVLTGASPASLAALLVVHVDLAARMVFLSDDMVRLGVQQRDGRWLVRLARQDAGVWTTVPQLPAITSLAELAAAHEAAK